MRRTAELAAMLVLALLAGACTTNVYEAAPATKKTTTTTTTTIAAPPATSVPTTTTTLPPTTTTTVPPCIGDVVTVLPGENDTVMFDNIAEPGGAYTVVVSSLIYNQRSDPITHLNVTFSYTTELAASGTGEDDTLLFTSIDPGASTAWTTDVSSPSPVTSVTITSISYEDVATGPGCGRVHDL